MNPGVVLVDMWAARLGEQSRISRPMTAERARLVPWLIVALVVIVLQEGLFAIIRLPHRVERLIQLFPGLASPEHAAFTFVLVVSLMAWLGVTTCRRALRRAHLNGLDQ